jgi:hypothetical protein
MAGQRASEAVEFARAEVAALVDASSSAVVFTSGATESDNLAVKGAWAVGASRRQSPRQGSRGATGHPAVLHSADRLTSVSTNEQHLSGLGLSAQREAIRVECERRGWNLLRIHEDVSSGTRRVRPGLNAAVDAVASGEAGGLIVAKLDRLSRSVAQFATCLNAFARVGSDNPRHGDRYNDRHG